MVVSTCIYCFELAVRLTKMPLTHGALSSVWLVAAERTFLSFRFLLLHSSLRGIAGVIIALTMGALDFSVKNMIDVIVAYISRTFIAFTDCG